MRSIILLVCVLTASSVFAAPRTPKAIENGQVDRSAAVDAEAVSQITPENVPAYETSLDGTSYTFLRIRKSGAEAVRIRFEDIRLAEDQGLLVYGSDANRVWVYDGGFSDSTIVTGDTVTIEIQCGQDCPADLPFQIAELEAVSPSTEEPVEHLPSPASETDEKRTGNFDGVDVEYVVRDGMAIFEGDMVLGRADEIEPARGVSKGSREALGIAFKQNRWPQGRIPYVISSAIPNKERITEAIQHWNTKLAGTISIVPRTTESTYVSIVRSSSCSSSVGMFLLNYMYLADSCSTGAVIHEFGHIVGLWHEQGRPDRNQHVKILTANILLTALGNFNIEREDSVAIGNYDFNSIMHYPAYAFSSNGKVTIETIPAGIPIGQRTALSAGDIAAVRSMYGTSTAPAAATPAPAPAPAPKPAPAPAPATVAITISANPATETIVVDGKSYVGKASLTWAIGSSHTLGATDRITSTSQMVFARWSDGGARAHTVVASSGVTAYKADFTVGYKLSAKVNNAAGGSVKISPAATSGYYAANSSVVLDAVASAGYCFTSWSGLIAGTSSHATISMTKAYDVTANFQTGAFSLSAAINYATKAGGQFTVGVSGSTGCKWTATSSVPWITFKAPVGGTGSGVLTYTIAANPTASARTAILTIANRTYLVSQAGSY